MELPAGVVGGTRSKSRVKPYQCIRLSESVLCVRSFGRSCPCTIPWYVKTACVILRLYNKKYILFILCMVLGDAEAEESMTLLIHPDSEIVAASQELPLVLIFEPAKNLHSLWFARYSTACEIDKVVEGVKTQKPGGESLHFHPDFVSSPKMVSKCHFGGHGSSSMSFPISPIASSPSVKPGAVLPDSAKRGSLHRDVLLSASGKYPFPDGSSFTPTSSLTNPLRLVNRMFCWVTK